MRIPEVRHEILDIALLVDDYLPAQAARLRELERELYRRPYVRKVGPRRQGAATKAKVLQYIKDHPDADYMEIATALSVNTARISEALAGFRQ